MKVLPLMAGLVLAFAMQTEYGERGRRRMLGVLAMLSVQLLQELGNHWFKDNRNSLKKSNTTA